MTSLASNEIFSVSSFIIIGLPTIIGSFLLYSSTNLVFDYLNPSSSTHSTIQNLLEPVPLSELLVKLYNVFSAHLTVLLACYLFLTLIAVVNLTNINQGPLRSHTYVQTNSITPPTI